MVVTIFNRILTFHPVQGQKLMGEIFFVDPTSQVITTLVLVRHFINIFTKTVLFKSKVWAIRQLNREKAESNQSQI